MSANIKFVLANGIITLDCLLAIQEEPVQMQLLIY